MEVTKEVKETSIKEESLEIKVEDPSTTIISLTTIREETLTGNKEDKVDSTEETNPGKTKEAISLSTKEESPSIKAENPSRNTDYSGLFKLNLYLLKTAYLCNYKVLNKAVKLQTIIMHDRSQGSLHGLSHKAKE